MHIRRGHASLASSFSPTLTPRILQGREDNLERETVALEQRHLSASCEETVFSGKNCISNDCNVTLRGSRSLLRFILARLATTRRETNFRRMEDQSLWLHFLLAQVKQ